MFVGAEEPEKGTVTALKNGETIFLGVEVLRERNNRS